MVLLLTAVLAGAVVQAGSEFGVPAPASAVAALLAAALLLALHGRERRLAGATAVPDVGAGTARGLLAAIVTVALLVRLPGLATRTTWEDEMWTLRNIYTSDWLELLRVAFDDYWPPLHYLLLNTIARIADTGILWLRLPSLIFGCLTVAVIYPLAMTLFGRRVVALTASALLAGMTSHVLYSGEARVYAMQLLLVVLSSWYFYRSYWERRISPAFLLTTTLLTWSHSFSSWYFIAGQCVYVVLAGITWRDYRALWKGVVSQTLVVLLWLPLVAAFLWARFQRGIVVPTQWATGADDRPGLLGMIELYQGLAVRSWAGAAFMALLFALALWLGWRQPPESRPASAAPGDRQAVVFLLCWAIVPILFSLSVTLGSSMTTFGEIRYHMTVLPGLCLLAAAGVGMLRTRTALAAVAAILVLLPAAQLPRHFRTYLQPATDEAAALIRKHGREGERIYAGNGYRALSYYLRGSFPRIGSAEWDSLTAAHAHLGDRHTQLSPKWGDTYAFERLSPRIAYVGYYGFDSANPESSYERFVREELARNGFQGTYWLVMEQRARTHFLPVLLRAGAVCEAPEVHQIRGLEVRRCNPPGG